MQIVNNTTQKTLARSRFLALLSEEHKQYLSAGANVRDYIGYSTIYNLGGKSVLNFISPSHPVEAGYTNIPNGKTTATQIVFVDTIRVVYGEVKKTEVGKTEEIEEALIPKEKILEVVFGAFPAVIRNAHLTFSINNVGVLTDFPLISFSEATQTDFPHSSYKLEQPYFIDKNKEFQFSLTLNKGLLKHGQVLRVVLQGLEIFNIPVK